MSCSRLQAQAEELTLLVAENSTGYFGVRVVKPSLPKPYQARVRRGGKQVYLGSFVTTRSEEAGGAVRRAYAGGAGGGGGAGCRGAAADEVDKVVGEAAGLWLVKKSFGDLADCFASRPYPPPATYRWSESTIEPRPARTSYGSSGGGALPGAGPRRAGGLELRPQREP